MSGPYETLVVSAPAEHLRVLTLHRPEAANALNTKMAEELPLALEAAARAECRCLVLTGAGERAFCAGADLKERHGMTDGALAAQRSVFIRAFRALADSPVPVIAAVNGAAYGGGCEIALACDFIYAARGARFALTETSLGLIPGGGATQSLARAVGMPRAKEIILSATPFTAEEAAAWDMVNRLCDPARLIADALTVAGKIAANAPLAILQARKAMRTALGAQFSEVYQNEIEAYEPLISSQDRREGIAAFNEKRSPRFTGR